MSFLIFFVLVGFFLDMYPSFTVLKKRNHGHLLSKTAANKKSIEQRLETHKASKKNYLQHIKTGR